MAKVTVDGIEIEIEEGTNIIEAAKAANIHVPHFCYHPSLSVVGQCRMCLVEIEGMPKLQAGCSTTIRDGMAIHVYNEKVDKARKGQMEFLLINHPLDCPICDKAGECPLQDYSFNYGAVESRYGEYKRTYPGMDRTAIGPHVLQNMNRCIHCTRCIRFTEEISGTGELAFFKRGAETEVGVFPGRPLDNWMSACVTDICPTGALTTRQFRFEQRVWNLDAAESVCNGCDVGCNIFVEFKNGRIYRYKPRVNPDVNDHWLCDYGRFSCERYETDRVVVPRIRFEEEDHLGIGSWSEVWEEIVSRLRQVSGEKLAVVGSAQLTNEEGWLIKRLFGDLLGSSRIDVTVDAIGPIRMKSRTGWHEGTEAGPNLRGLRSLGFGSGDSIESLLSEGAEAIDVLYVTDTAFSDRTRDPAVIERLRKASYLIVHAWENHPLAEVADVVLPSSIFAEKSGTWTNGQNRVQRIRQAYLPKGEALTDWEIIRRLGARLFPAEADFRAETPDDTFDTIREKVEAFRDLEWDDETGHGSAPSPPAAEGGISGEARG
ncbi:MAG TPA: 2Fe-2S iron-sulfur cluster-binding protein [Thermoanaerobaculia bacterium]|nr:2Fe-2S iron-sulfur cluster-binding protein [Thermoanaerobaculia bacterium]